MFYKFLSTSVHAELCELIWSSKQLPRLIWSVVYLAIEVLRLGRKRLVIIVDDAFSTWILVRLQPWSKDY
jgi:hypothetical protein